MDHEVTGFSEGAMGGKHPFNNPAVKSIYCNNNLLGLTDFSSTGTSERSREFHKKLP